MFEAILGALLGGLITAFTSYAVLYGRVSALENKKIKEVVGGVLGDNTQLKGLLGETQIEIGEIDTDDEYNTKTGYPGLGHYIVTENGKAHKQYVKFKTEFSEKPEVVVSFSLIDSEIDVSNSQSPKSLRVKLKAQDITKEGFNLKFNSWDTSRSYQAKVVYIALGKISKN